VASIDHSIVNSWLVSDFDISDFEFTEIIVFSSQSAIRNLQSAIQNGRIRLLPEIVASQVAAGEVVERPASVVKELIENSLDAGAAENRHPLFDAGGISLVRVIDDGCGMDRDDALLSLERHATSKIDLLRTSSSRYAGISGRSAAEHCQCVPISPDDTETDAMLTEIITWRQARSRARGGEAPGTQVEVARFSILPPEFSSENTEKPQHRASDSFTSNRPSSDSFLIACETTGCSFGYLLRQHSSDRIRDLYGARLLERPC